MLSIVILLSGSGSNARALLEACDNPLFPAKVLAVGSDKATAGLEHAEQFGVPTFCVEPSRFDSKEAWASVLGDNVDYFKPDLVVLAGFMKVLPKGFVERFSQRLINLHPSLLPKYPGAHAVRDALAAGETVTGSTIHFVDEGVDTGAVISQVELPISQGVSESDLHEQIKQIERTHLVSIVREFAEGKRQLKGN